MGQKQVRNGPESNQKQIRNSQVLRKLRKSLGPHSFPNLQINTSSSGGDVVKCDVRVPRG